MSQEQAKAALRHVGTAAATAFTIFAGLGAMSQSDAQVVIENIHLIADRLTDVVGAAWKIGVIVGPIFMALFPKWAGQAASLTGVLKSLTNNPNAKIEGQIVVPPKVAADVPSNQVVPEEKK